MPLRDIFMMCSLNEGILMQLPNEREASRADMARRLSEHTAITLPQATDLVRCLGMDWSSLVREAKLIKALLPGRVAP